MVEIRRVFEENFRVYGVCKVWRQLGREGIAVARCTVARLMRTHGAAERRARQKGPDDDPRSGSRLPARPRQPPVQDTAAECLVGLRLHLRRDLERLRLRGLRDRCTYSRRIVGWRVSRTAHAAFVLDALEQALHERRPAKGGGLVHHSDRGSQYLALRYTERLAEAGIEPSVGSVGDSYDNALAETINGLYKAEVIHRCGPWRSFEAVEFATLEWVDWFNHRRLLEPIGNVPPAEAEALYYAQINNMPLAA